MKAQVIFIFCLSFIASVSSCKNPKNNKQTNQFSQKVQTDSIRTLSNPKSKETFQGKKIWIKQFQCDGFFYTGNIFTDSMGNLFWFVHFKGVLKIDSTNIFKNYSDKILVLQFDSKGNLNYDQYIGGNGENLLQILQYQDSFYPVFIEQPTLYSIPQEIARSMSNNVEYKKESITIYEVSINKKATIHLNFTLNNQKRLSSIQFDKNQNLILAGSKDIEFEKGMGQCTPYTRITNSVPYIEKRKNDSLVWELTCSKHCIGKISDLFIDEQNDIWVNFQINNCDTMPCFNTTKYSGDREKSFIAKVSEDGSLIITKDMDEYNTKWLTIQKFKKDRIIIHSNSSCFTHTGVKHSPIMAYDLNFNKKWEKCFSDSTDDRFDFAILPQSNQIIAVGHKRTGMIQPGEKQKDYLDKQRAIILKYDTLGDLKWQKTINEPLRILNLEKGKKEDYYVMFKADFYLNKRVDYSMNIEGEQFNTDKKDNYFLIKYK